MLVFLDLVTADEPRALTSEYAMSWREKINVHYTDDTSCEQRRSVTREAEIREDRWRVVQDGVNLTYSQSVIAITPAC